MIAYNGVTFAAAAVVSEATAAFGDDAPLMMALADGVVGNDARLSQNPQPTRRRWRRGCFSRDTGGGDAAGPEPSARHTGDDRSAANTPELFE